MNIVVWNEYRHERKEGVPADLYPDGIHSAIAESLRSTLGENAGIQTATLDEPEHGLSVAVLDSTDVLVWWGHIAHDEVTDEIARRVQQRVLEGMGLVVLHSAHYSKPFRLLMGTSCGLRWREEDDRELIWVVDPSHQIAAGIPAVIPLASHEMYGEFFEIPAPDELVFISSFTGGEVWPGTCEATMPIFSSQYSPFALSTTSSALISEPATRSPQTQSSRIGKSIVIALMYPGTSS